MKAVVVETRGPKAAVLPKDGTFRIAHGHYQVGETIDYRDETPSLRRCLAAAAAVVVGVGIGGGFWYDANYVAYGEVSIDAEPSIVYTVNKKNQVLSVTAANEEAESVVSMLEQEGIRFMPISGAVEKTMGIFATEGYLDEGREDCVLVSVSADDRRRDRLSSEVEAGMRQAAAPMMEYRIDQTERDTAGRLADDEIKSDDHRGEGEARDTEAKHDSMEQPDEENRQENSPPDRQENGREGFMPNEMPHEEERPDQGEIPGREEGIGPGGDEQTEPAEPGQHGSFEEEPARAPMDGSQPMPNEQPAFDRQPFDGEPSEEPQR